LGAQRTAEVEGFSLFYAWEELESDANHVAEKRLAASVQKSVK